MHRPATRLLAASRVARLSPYVQPRRTLFGGLLGKFGRKQQPAKPAEPQPLLSQDDLFHPFSKSPFPAIRARGDAIRSMAPCPVCTSTHEHQHEHTPAQPRTVSFECPDCGWPTHCSEEHWAQDEEHSKYCSRLREVNEDEHDLRSGRRMIEFEMPGEQDSEAAVSFANWDLFWYTRQFPSMDTERSRRHSSKVLTYPITIASVLHQYSGLMLSNQRLTPEGARSLAALRSTLHVPTGAPETPEAAANKPQVRVFILGARAESSLPANVWEQLTMLFPAGQLHLFFIGPQVSLPNQAKPASQAQASQPEAATNVEQKSPSSEAAEAAAALDGATPAHTSLNDQAPEESLKPTEPEKPVYLPNVYEPPTPRPIMRLKRTRSSVGVYGVPSYTLPYTPALTVTGMQASYMDVHAQFQETFDPYTDVFFLFSPGFGFPSPTAPPNPDGTPVLQIAAEKEWGPVLPTLLASKCAIFVTGFSPADVERDVKALSTAPGVAGEFDWVLTPGPNAFGSEKWEVADFDPRVMVKTNWGIWGIRGKRRDVQERRSFTEMFMS